MEFRQILPMESIRKIMVIPENFTAESCEVIVKPVKKVSGRRAQLAVELSEMCADLREVNVDEIIDAEIRRKNCL